MSEYIEIEVEETDAFDVLVFNTNLTLADGADEHYASADEMEEGSALAQFLSPIPGILQLQIEDSTLIITRDPDVPWHSLIDDVSAAIKEFFL